MPYRVDGAARGDGKENPKEALAVASLLVAACSHEAYAGKTFGVISLLGDDQAMMIEGMLLRHMPAGEYKRRRIVCGNSAHFQGDERDVMFLSMVDSSSDGPLPMRAGDDDLKRRFNVAASRARDQMWVVYSLDHETDLQPGDLRRRLIAHALDPQAVTRELDQGQFRTESVFEQQVYERLVRRGYRVKPQWKVGRYRIDLVVGGETGRVAVECDGDRYHGLEDLPDDMARQAILERMGWRFIRIRGSVFFRDPDATMNRLFERLEGMGIAPEGDAATAGRVRGAEPDNVVDEVRRRAEELCRQWQAATARDGEPELDTGLRTCALDAGGAVARGGSGAVVRTNDDSAASSQVSAERTPAATGIPFAGPAPGDGSGHDAFQRTLEYSERIEDDGEPNESELESYRSYEHDMRKSGLPARPVDEWVQGVRKARRRQAGS